MGASPSDRANLAPIDLGRKREQIRRGLSILFLTQDHEPARGVGTGSDLSANIGVGYYDAQGQAMRGAAADNSYVQGRRGHMNILPTPQALIRQITGVGDPPQGR